MSIPIIITICFLLILAYIFDISSTKTKIPSVILLLIVGWAVRQATDALPIFIPDLTPLLPILGTIGLILIVLEGSLELELNKSKFHFVGKSALVAFIPMIIFSIGLAFAFQHFGNVDFKIALSNAIPLAIISSAIAIPSVQNLSAKNKEFITYESSLSDIFGVVLFNFVTLNDNIGTQSFGFFILELLGIFAVSIISTIGLAYLLSKINHPVKFIPIILMVVLIYAISKLYHLPALIFILFFGLFLANLDEFKSYKFITKLRPDILNKEVHKFKELTAEIVFLVRTLFFLLFGYLIQTKELLNAETIIWAISISASIYLLRYITLKIFRINIKPIFFVAPRGLITILLFLTIPIGQTIDLLNKSLIIQVIILTALIMMVGLMAGNKLKPLSEHNKSNTASN